MKPRRPAAVILCVLVTVAVLAAAARRGTSSREPAGAVLAEMRNVHYHVDNDTVLRIRTLRGALIPLKKGVPPTFDDKNSFLLRIDSAEIALSATSLTNLMNRHVFARDDSPVKELRISFEEGELKQEGRLRNKGPDLPFTVRSKVSVASDGRIQLHATSIKAAGLPVKGFMKLFGLRLDKLIALKEDRGIAVRDNDMFLDAARILPAPQARGRVTAVRVEGDHMVQVFGRGAAAGPSAAGDPNYMWYRGNTLRFGKLTMSNTDLKIIDADPNDPFDFNLDFYNDQLVAGYSKNTPDHGLRVVMPDHDNMATLARGGLAPRLRMR